MNGSWVKILVPMKNLLVLGALSLVVLLSSGCISTGHSKFEKQGVDCKQSDSQYYLHFFSWPKSNKSCAPATPVPVSVAPQTSFIQPQGAPVSYEQPLPRAPADAQVYVYEGRYYIKVYAGGQHSYQQCQAPVQLQVFARR